MPTLHDQLFAAAAPVLLGQFGELLEFVPLGGPPRSVTAIVAESGGQHQEEIWIDAPAAEDDPFGGFAAAVGDRVFRSASAEPYVYLGEFVRSGGLAKWKFQRLRQQVTLERPAAGGRDARGKRQGEWVAEATVFAAFRRLAGGEQEVQGQLRATATHLAVLAAAPGISPDETWRIVAPDAIHNILAFDPQSWIAQTSEDRQPHLRGG